MPGKELWFGRKVEGFVLNCNVIPCTTGESMKPCLHQCQKLTHHLGLSIVAVQARENTLSFLYYETEAPQDVWNNERLSKLYLYTCISSTNNHHKTPTFSTLCDFFFFFLSACFNEINICSITRIYTVCRWLQLLCFPYISLTSLDHGFHLAEGKQYMTTVQGRQIHCNYCSFIVFLL